MHESTTYLLIIGAAVVALAALAAIVNNVVSIVRGLRRDPPLPEEMAKGYATKQELADEIAELKLELKAERDRIDDIMNQQFNLLRELTEKTNQWQLGVERMIGRIEGKVDKK